LLFDKKLSKNHCIVQVVFIMSPASMAWVGPVCWDEINSALLRICLSYKSP